MKLLRYGPPGHEKPGLLDRDGKIRDLAGVIGDIDGETLAPASLDRLRHTDPASLPLVAGAPRLGPVRRPGAKIYRHRPQLPPARGGDGGGDPKGADHFYEGDVVDLRPGR